MSSRKFRIRPAARRDLEAYVDYLVAEAGHDVAQRFIENGQKSFAALAATPGLGATVSSRNPQLAGLRKWRVDGFPKLLIFYIPTETDLRIVRVIHAARDWTTLVDADGRLPAGPG